MKKLKDVMVVDDSEPDQFLAQVVIEKFDPEINIIQAGDGKEALEILAKLPRQPDIIFLDINMPRMNGHEFLAVYNEWKNKSSVVIMLTSSNQESDKALSVAHDCVVKYFTKPLSVSDLELAVGINTIR